MITTRLFALLLFVLTGTVHAQCTKDTDCKGTRICENGKCVNPTQSSSALGSSTPQAPAQPETARTPANADKLGPALEDLFRCARNPEPSIVFGVLAASNYIGKKPKLVSDGAPVFTVTKPLFLFGFPVVEISGFDPNSVKPGSRSPGTLSPLFFAAVVEGDIALVKLEAQKRSGGAASVSPASYSTYRRPSVEITCFGK